MTEDEEKRNPLTFTIDELKLSVRSTLCLKRHGINTLCELCSLTESEVKQVKNLGTKCLQEIKGKLAEYGLHLARLEKQRARDTVDGISTGRHRQALEALKILNQYCEGVFDNTDGCENCVFCPTYDGQRWCPLHGSFTPTMWIGWEERVRELEGKG